jgi:hypothetical protein
VNTETADTESASAVEQQRAFAGVTAFSLLLTAGVWLESIPASLVSGVQAAVIITALFALTALVPSWAQSKFA